MSEFKISYGRPDESQLRRFQEWAQRDEFDMLLRCLQSARAQRLVDAAECLSRSSRGGAHMERAAELAREAERVAWLIRFLLRLRDGEIPQEILGITPSGPSELEDGDFRPAKPIP